MKHKEVGKEKEKTIIRLESFGVPKGKMHRPGRVAPPKQVAKKKKRVTSNRDSFIEKHTKEFDTNQAC